MKIIDVSRELFSTPVYPGDPEPLRDLIRRMSMGDECNLSGFYTGCHSATHVDAPRHFVDDGATIDQVELDRFTGRCTVVDAVGIISGAVIDEFTPKSEKMILFKGNGKAFLSESAAFALVDAGATLIGTDAQSIESDDDQFPAHKQLLGEGIPILEGLDLSKVEPGNYQLFALPLFLAGAEASPVRAILIEE